MRLPQLAATALMGTLLLAPTVVAAEPDDAPATLQDEEAAKANAGVHVLYGHNAGTGIDSKIPADFRDKLGEPPFASYDSYDLESNESLALEKGESKEMSLPDDSKLKVQLKDVVEKNGSKRYIVEASISKPGGKKFLPVLQVNAKPGEVFFVAGQKYKKGILVLGIKVQGN